MSQYPIAEKWNTATAILGQALLGTISPNVRAISLSFEEDDWKIVFILEQENEDDREELLDALSDFEGIDPSISGQYKYEFVVTRERIFVPALPGRFIYWRREQNGPEDGAE